MVLKLYLLHVLQLLGMATYFLTDKDKASAMKSIKMLPLRKLSAVYGLLDCTVITIGKFA